MREQIETNLTQQHPYDIDSAGLLVWPTKRFDVEIVADLEAEGTITPLPALQAAEAGLAPIERERLVFSATHTDWKKWERIWSDNQLATSSNTKISFPSRE